jgi:hypothetical protein
LKLYIGKQTPEHKGDTSRELIDMWEESGYCEIVRDEVEDVFIWANSPNDILLYEYDRFDVYPHLPKVWNRGLFGGMQSQDKRSVPWIYWARHPRKLEREIRKGLKSYEDRDIESVFLGRIENHVQFVNRTKENWESHVDLFSMPNVAGGIFKYPYTQDEYLETISCAKFGLSMAGYGPKCNREVEYMGLGVVPIVTPEVDMTYYDPLEEGVHYFRARNPIEFQSIVDQTSEERWGKMSKACTEWYSRNCSREGSFKTTESIVREQKHN